ncbi:MAG TPA: hypothetical protein VFD42_06875 [Chloroflexota bacterium]|nr:hypothetical protein [Chloroflexota bacterium]
MTHSLHRLGKAEELKNDYVLMVTPAIGFNHEGKKEALQKVVDIVYEVGPNNIASIEATGTIYTGTTKDDIKNNIHDKGRVRCCFDSKEKMAEVVRRLKEADLGVSIIVSGLIEEVVPMAKAVGFEPHTVNLSLGIHGKTSCLPSRPVQEIASMCGHGLVAYTLARAMIKEVKAGRKSLDEAAVKLAQPCFCGIFNTDRARQLLLAAELEDAN